VLDVINVPAILYNQSNLNYHNYTLVLIVELHFYHFHYYSHQLSLTHTADIRSVMFFIGTKISSWAPWCSRAVRLLSISTFAFGLCSSLVLLFFQVRHGISRDDQFSDLLAFRNRNLKFTILNGHAILHLWSCLASTYTKFSLGTNERRLLFIKIGLWLHHPS
jgi:hypothetical protein